MSQPDVVPSNLLQNDGESHKDQAGPSIENPASRLEDDFNFHIVIFEVENRLFKVLMNGFNVPGTPFEAMFALPQTQTDNIEGSRLENPIHLPGIKVEHFRSFLRILYPFVGQKPVVEFDEWVGVLNLATMWLFQEIRGRAITKLSELINQKTVMERIVLAREYRVAEWLRDAYLELALKSPLDFEELRPAEPYYNPLDKSWESDIKKCESMSRYWETLARISNLQTKAATSMSKSFGGCYHCSSCKMDFGRSSSNGCLCKCRLLRLVDETFKGELESLKENPGNVE